jgi:hypothetical protein
MLSREYIRRGEIKKLFFCNALSSASCRTMKCNSKNKTHCIFFYDPNTERAEASKPAYIPLKKHIKNKRRKRRREKDSNGDVVK